MNPFASRPSIVDGAAWVPYTPGVAASSGTITTLGTVTGSYKAIGSTVHFNVSISITTNGTAGTAIIFTLPGLPKYNFAPNGYEAAVYGGQMQVRGQTSGICVVYKEANAYPGQDGCTIVISGTYESA